MNTEVHGYSFYTDNSFLRTTMSTDILKQMIARVGRLLGTQVSRLRLSFYFTITKVAPSS